MHLQCHTSTDTVSVARLGASVTGLDFSGAAPAEARRLAAAADAGRKRPGGLRRHDRPLANSVSHSWNHSLGEIITALLNNGVADEGHTLAARGSYTLQAVKNG
ncbi:hypothetical protein [Amycolatopsis lexingtonensis]|uniref:hypothetical protein n=1 Tax=Amycolatopsis lexingtonensis TaxID=218822 RepID=UPI003F6F6E50